MSEETIFEIDLEREMKNFAKKLHEAIEAAEKFMEVTGIIDEATVCGENRLLLAQSHILLTSYFSRSLMYANILLDKIQEEIGYNKFKGEENER